LLRSLWFGKIFVFSLRYHTMKKKDLNISFITLNMGVSQKDCKEI